MNNDQNMFQLMSGASAGEVKCDTGTFNHHVEVTIVDPQNAVNYTLLYAEHYGQMGLDYATQGAAACNYTVTTAVNAIRIYAHNHNMAGSYIALELN